MKGCKLNGQYRIWKYSSSANLFSEILAPQQISDKFVLTPYNSQLLLIDAVLRKPDEYDEEMAENYGPEYKLDKLDIDVWVLVKNKFERSTEIPNYLYRSGNPLPLNEDEHGVTICEPLEPKYWEIRATSQDGNLVVAFYRKDSLFDPDRCYSDDDILFVTVEILLFEGSKNEWSYKAGRRFATDENYMDDDENDSDDSEGSIQDAPAATIIDRPSITINNDTLYVKVWNERYYKNYCGLDNISMEFLRRVDKGIPLYIFSFCKDFPSFTLPKRHSNISVYKNQIIVAIPRDEELFVLALLQTKPDDIWIEIAHIKLGAKFEWNPCIMGLPDDSSILVIGMVKSANQSGIQTSTLQTLKLTSKGIVVCILCMMLVVLISG